MDCNKMTREQLIERFASDWGHSSEKIEKYHTEILREACESGTPFNSISLIEHFINKGLIDIDELNKRAENLK